MLRNKIKISNNQKKERSPNIYARLYYKHMSSFEAQCVALREIL